MPGSKSETNRALLLAALADAPSQIVGALDARDSQLMRAALVALGAEISPLDAETVTVVPPAHFQTPSEPIDVGLAGNVLRFIPPLAALADGVTQFLGDRAVSERPVAPLLSGLRQLGVGINGDAVPFQVTGGKLTGNEAVIDASGSSQFVSGLLLAAARFPHGLTLRHHNDHRLPVPSRPHLDMTVTMLRDRGVRVETPDDHTWVVYPGPIAALDQRVEPDLTNAAAFLAAAALAGGSTRVPGWPTQTTQGGDAIRDILAAMGAVVTRDGDQLVVSRRGALRGIDVDLHGSSELTPVVAALASVTYGHTEIRGVAHIRGHETDRLAALSTELAGLGVDVMETDDGLSIEGRGAPALHGATFHTYADHRMAHAGALLGLVVPGVELDDVACTSKTLPDFVGMWEQLLASSSVAARSAAARSVAAQ